MYNAHSADEHSIMHSSAVEMGISRSDYHKIGWLALSSSKEDLKRRETLLGLVSTGPDGKPIPLSQQGITAARAKIDPKTGTHLGYSRADFDRLSKYLEANQ